MHLVDFHDSVHGIEICLDGTAVLLDLEFEGVHDIEYGGIGIDILDFQRRASAVEHRHLEHLLHLETQAFCLIVYHGGYLLEHGGTLAHALVVEHLCRQAYGGYGRLEFVCHVVDEIVLHLGQFLLPEGHDNGVDEYYQQNECEGERRHHEGY